MSDICEITRIAHNEEKIAQLKKTLAETLNHIHKQELALNILKKLDVNQVDVSDRQQLQRSVKILSIQNYLHLENSDTLLGLEAFKEISLSYTERKALRLYLIANIRKICTPTVDYVDQIKAEIPRIFEVNYHQTEMLELEEKRRQLQNELIRVKNRKCSLLKICTELKLGSYQKNALEVLRAEFKLNKIKAGVLHRYLVQEFCSRTDHAMKAIKEIERYVDAELETLDLSSRVGTKS